MNEVKKMPFFERVKSSIIDFDKYAILATLNIKTTIFYIVKLIAIFSLVVTIIFIYGMSKKVNEVKNYIENEISNISYKDGNITINENNPIFLENEEIISKIIIDTSETAEEENYVEEIKKTSNGIILLKNKVIIKSNMSNAIVSYTYKELSDEYNIYEFEKNDLLEQFQFDKIIVLYVAVFLMAFSYLFLVYFSDALINALLLAALGYLSAILLKLRLRYSAMFKMSIYALTLPIILNIIYVILNYFADFTIKYFDAMYIAIAYIYIITAILLIKSDVIKKGKELTKIIEEQQKVRQELERKKLEEEEAKREQEQQRQREKQKKKEKEENDNEDKRSGERENKKENNENDEGNIAGQPQGGNA